MRVRTIAAAGVLAALSLAVGASANPPGSDAAATVALQWNANAVAAVRAATTTNQPPPGAVSRSLYQTEGLLYMSYVQAAVYDAATKIGHRYVPYHHFSVGAGDASIEAAVIAAAYKTLVAYLGHTTTLDGQYEASIAALPNDQNTARGIAVGEAAAADIVALRANDGRNAASPAPTVGTPTIPVQAGVWVWPPAPSLQIDQTPWMAVMQPFMLDSTSQFRAPPPNALTSAQYATDLNETEAAGSNLPAGDPRRDTAWFWNANLISQLNKTLQDFATQNHMDLLDTVRLLAMGNMVTVDAGMACFDSKYIYRFWRPITAIRNDGNPADTTWSPLTTTPNHPEYPSQHGCSTGALAQVLAHAIGSNQINATIWGATAATPTGLVTSRTYPTVQNLLDELVNARVWIGFHFRSSVIAGENLGTSVANWELQRFFLPTN
jgi:PAP2 superfamily protein